MADSTWNISILHLYTRTTCLEISFSSIHLFVSYITNFSFRQFARNWTRPTNTYFFYLRAASIQETRAFTYIYQAFSNRSVCALYHNIGRSNFPTVTHQLFLRFSGSHSLHRSTPVFFEILRHRFEINFITGRCTVSPQLTSPISNRARFLFQFHLNNDHRRPLPLSSP